MAKYRINKITKKIIEDNGNLGDFFFTSDWKIATTKEVNDYFFNTTKENKLLENNEKCSAYILSVYPIYKQMNIINQLSGYSIEDKTKMNEFIDSQRAKNKDYKKQILAEKIQSKEDLDKIVIEYGE